MLRALLPICLATSLYFAAAAAAAQSVSVRVEPDRVAPGDPVTLVLEVAEPDCNGFAFAPVQRVGHQLSLEFTLDPSQGTCGVPPPITRRTLALGGFPPGSYSVTVQGRFLPAGPTLGPASAGFVVLPGPRRVPVDAGWALLLLGAATLALGARRAARG